MKIFRINVCIAILSLLGLYFLDYPLELVPTSGIAWVLISSLESLRQIRRK